MLALPSCSALACARRSVSAAPQTRQSVRAKFRRGREEAAPANVMEARAWIAAWQAKQKFLAGVAARAAQAKGVSIVSSSAAAPPPPPSDAAGWGKALPDGSVVFTAVQLRDSARTATAMQRVRSGSAPPPPPRK